MAFGSVFTRGTRWNKAFFGDVGSRLLILATWIPVVCWFRFNVAEVITITGPSMYPFLNSDKDITLRPDVVLNSRWKPHQKLERGMIITFMCPHKPDGVAVKRIVGLEGDIVQTDSPAWSGTVRVPQGHIWVEGDGAKGDTVDSNTYGPISKMLVTGRITHFLYPFNKIGRVKWWEHQAWRTKVVGQ